MPKILTPASHAPQAHRVALYARVSSERQREEATIGSQLAALRERLTAEGYHAAEAHEFIDDGYSGTVLQRPALERLRDLAASGGIDRLYVLDPDRLARRYAYQVLVVEELQRAGVLLCFLHGSLGETPEQVLFLQLQGMIAEYERVKILERTRRGRLHAARRGDVAVFSHAPYGYRYIPKTDGGEARFQVVFEQACVIRQMFEWIGRERVTLREVTRRLRKQGVLSPEGHLHWNPSTISHMLKNPAYCGQAAYGKRRSVERRLPLRVRRGGPAVPRRLVSLEWTPESDWIRVEVPALVSAELFQEVNEQLADNARRSRARRQGAPYLLQGLLVCGRCGSAYCGRRGPTRGDGQRYCYYRCQGSDKSRFEGQTICPNRSVPLAALDDAVWSDLRRLLEDPEQLEREYASRLQANAAPLDAERPLRQKRITTVRRAIERLIDAYTEGLLEKSEFEPRLNESKTRLKQLEAEQAAVADREQERVELRLAMDHLQTFCTQVHDSLDRADTETRRRIIRALVKRIEIHDHEVRVVYRVQPPTSAQNQDAAVSHYCSTRPPAACG